MSIEQTILREFIYGIIQNHSDSEYSKSELYFENRFAFPKSEDTAKLAIYFKKEYVEGELIEIEAVLLQIVSKEGRLVYREYLENKEWFDIGGLEEFINNDPFVQERCFWANEDEKKNNYIGLL